MRNAIDEIIATVIKLNPRLKNDNRISNLFVTNIFKLFNSNTNKININYDALMHLLCLKIQAPEYLIEPFVSVFITGLIHSNSEKKFYRVCSKCAESHGIDEDEKCTYESSSIIKVPSGFISVKDLESEEDQIN